MKKTIITIGIGIAILAVLVVASKGIHYTYKSLNLETFFEPEYIVANISCKSDSMGLVLNCGDKVELEPFNGNLKVGRIYVFNSTKVWNETNMTVIHRFVGCVDEDCNVTIFKGDNNLNAELVKRSDILYEVKKIVMA